MALLQSLPSLHCHYTLVELADAVFARVISAFSSGSHWVDFVVDQYPTILINNCECTMRFTIVNAPEGLAQVPYLLKNMPWVSGISHRFYTKAVALRASAVQRGEFNNKMVSRPSLLTCLRWARTNMIWLALTRLGCIYRADTSWVDPVSVLCINRIQGVHHLEVQ